MTNFIRSEPSADAPDPPGMEIADFFHLPAWHYEPEAV
ncbi:hypothetical protein ACVK00_005819 [Burkholderia sp. PvR073]